MFTRQKVAMLVAEFFGAAVLTLAVLSVSLSNIGIGYFVSFGVGLAMAVLVLALWSVSGAVFNPALTLGLWSIRKLETLQALSYIVVQLLGGYLAYLLFNYMTGTDLSNRQAEYNTQVLVAEVVGTTVLAFGFAAAVFQNLVGGTRAAVIGGALAVGVILASAQTAAGYLNPAVALGANLWEWGTYVLGPVLGALIGFNLYALLFATRPVVATATNAASAATKTTVAKRKPATKVAKKKTTRK